MWPLSVESSCPILLCHHQSQFGTHLSPAENQNKICLFSVVQFTNWWLTDLSSSFSSAILPSFNEASIPVSSHNPVIQSGSIHKPDGIFCINPQVKPWKTIQDVSIRWIIKNVPTYSTKQKPHGVLVNLSSPMMILLTSPHLPNNS